LLQLVILALLDPLLWNVDPFMVTLDPPLLYYKDPGMEGENFLVPDPLHNFFMDPGPSEPGGSSFLLIYYGSWISRLHLSFVGTMNYFHKIFLMDLD
jgi:hypothetical protein